LTENPFEGVSGFEWNTAKAASNRRKHGIDFDDAKEVFHGRVVVRQSTHSSETRWIVIGESEDGVIAVICTRRGSNIRIISARHARKNEERAYRNATV
jgi:uncharacterized DUF497 family protein